MLWNKMASASFEKARLLQPGLCSEMHIGRADCYVASHANAITPVVRVKVVNAACAWLVEIESLV